ncbi:thioredoxin M1, chloroplastic [Oryza brachyantha]|nr:thioredoxin M1, chloroplastic [Oryza brachyantha]
MASSPLAVPVAKAASTPPFAVSVAAAVAPQRRLLPQCRGVRAAPLRLRSGRGRGRGASVVRAAQGQETSFQVPDVTKSTWQSLVVESELPVLVEFWASWCGPCKMIDPVIGKLSKEYEGKLNCYKLNTDENPDITTQFGIRSIPTMMIFKNGEKKDTVIGAVPESTLVSSIDKYVGR